MRILINNEEVLCDKDINITEEMLNTSSTILKNCYPKSWEDNHTYTDYYYPKDYSKCLIYNDENELIFCGVVKNTGNINLNPRQPHYADLQVLDFKTFLSIGETFDFVINQLTIEEAIELVIRNVAEYGVVKGNINLLDNDEVIGAYSTLNKTAYDVFNYLAEISESRWTTRLVDENTIAVDFYDPSLMPVGTNLEYTQEFFEENQISDMTYSYSTGDYRNKQIMTSNQIYSTSPRIEAKTSTGFGTIYFTEDNIYSLEFIDINEQARTFATLEEKEMGITADFYYTPGGNTIESAEILDLGTTFRVAYFPIVQGREVITNPSEIDRISNSTNRSGVISRYENRNDALSSNELLKIGESYLKYKGTPEIILRIETFNKNLWNVGQVVNVSDMPLEELNRDYMVKVKNTKIIATTKDIFYEYELTSSYNSEREINYFDNQRNKSKGNLQSGEYINRNIDINTEATIVFTEVNAREIVASGYNVLNAPLNIPLIGNYNNILDNALDSIFME